MATDFTQFLDPSDITSIQALVNALSKTTPPDELFNIPDVASFRGQAEADAGPFFDKDLALLNKEIETAKQQQRQKKELAEKFQAQQEKQYFRVEDRSFGRALQAAQSGFAGRGTFTSGVRDRAIGDQQTDRQEKLLEAQTGFNQLTEERNQGFDQFLENTDLQAERGKLEIERSREGEILGRQSQLATQALSKQQQQIGQYDRDFNRVIGFSNFLNQKLAG